VQIGVVVGRLGVGFVPGHGYHEQRHGLRAGRREIGLLAILNMIGFDLVDGVNEGWIIGHAGSWGLWRSFLDGNGTLIEEERNQRRSPPRRSSAAVHVLNGLAGGSGARGIGATAAARRWRLGCGAAVAQSPLKMNLVQLRLTVAWTLHYSRNALMLITQVALRPP
jgi:hypothetical protein